MLFMTHAIDSLREAVRRGVQHEGLRPFAARTGVPVGQVRSVAEGRAMLSTTLVRLCAALDLEFHIGPPRMVEADQALRREISHDPLDGLVAVRDHEIAAVITALADEYEALNEPGRRSLLKRFWGLFPDLRERERELARVVAWLGWRLVEARHRAPGEGCG